MDIKNNDKLSNVNTSSKRVRVKRSMLVEQGDNVTKANKSDRNQLTQESNDFGNDISFTGQDCDFVNRLKQDSRAQSPLLNKTSARTSPVPRYSTDDPPSWLASPKGLSSNSRQTSDSTDLDTALGLKNNTNNHSSSPRTSTRNSSLPYRIQGEEGAKSVPLSPMMSSSRHSDIIRQHDNLSQKFSTNIIEPSSAPIPIEGIDNISRDFEKSLRSEVSFQRQGVKTMPFDSSSSSSPPPSSLNNDNFGPNSVPVVSKRRLRRSESVSMSEQNPALIDSNYAPRIVKTATASSNATGNAPPSGPMWGGASAQANQHQGSHHLEDTSKNRRNGSWLDESPPPMTVNDHNSLSPVGVRSSPIIQPQLSPNELNPTTQHKSAYLSYKRQNHHHEQQHQQQQLNARRNLTGDMTDLISDEVSAIEEKWKKKYNDLLLEAEKSKVALLQAQHTIKEQAGQILSLETEIKKQRNTPINHQTNHHPSEVEVEAKQGGLAFDIDVGNNKNDRARPSGTGGSTGLTSAQVAKSSDGQPPSKLMARLGMSATQRRMLGQVEPDAKLNRILLGDDALPSALPPSQVQGNNWPNNNNNSLPGHSAMLHHQDSKPQNVTWQDKDPKGGIGGGMDKVAIYRTMSGRRFGDGTTMGQRCATCGVTRGLEADEDNPGTYYCVSCWEDYEEEDDDLNEKSEEKMVKNKSLGSSKSFDASKLSIMTPKPLSMNATSSSPISDHRGQHLKSPIKTSPLHYTQDQQRPSYVKGEEEEVGHKEVEEEEDSLPFGDRCFILSDNTHLLNQVASLLSKGGGGGDITALVETKGTQGKVRIVSGKVITVGCCHAVGSQGADLGTDIVVATSLTSTNSNLVEFDGSRGSMYLELSSLIAHEKEVDETKQETIGDFKGFRMLASDGLSLDGRRMDPEWKAKAEKKLGIKVQHSAKDRADMSWWMKESSGRIDVILSPQHKGDWFPMWEIGSGRKMAPQFRSSGVGYLRLADDMGSNGTSFISIDGHSYLAGAGFDEDEASSSSNAGDMQGTPNTVRRRRAEEGARQDPLSKGKSLARDAKEALNALKSGCGAGGENELKWKEKVDLLRKASSALEQVCAIIAASTPGNVLPLAGTTSTPSVVGHEEAVNGISVAQRVLGDRGKNVHVLSGALALLKSSGMVCGDKCPAAPAWRVVFPQLLTLFRDSAKVVATAATNTADALHLRCFRIGDPSSLSFIIAELHLLGGGKTGVGEKGSKPSSGGGGGNKTQRAVSAVAMVGWILRALSRERTVCLQNGGESFIGSQHAASEALASALLPLLTHRELDTRDLSAQALASVLLATEANMTAKGGGVQHQTQHQGHLSLLLPVSTSDPKAYARVINYLTEGRKRGEHLPIRGGGGTTLNPHTIKPRPPSSSSVAKQDPKRSEDGLNSLRQLWGQIEYVLRKPVSSSADLDGLAKHAALGSAYLNTLSTTASKLGLRKGALSRAVLPYDDQTSLSDQSNLGNRKTRSLEARELIKSGQLSETQLDRMQIDAVKLRALLRVKIADDADLDQAKAAIDDILVFLQDLGSAAKVSNTSSFALLQTL